MYCLPLLPRRPVLGPARSGLGMFVVRMQSVYEGEM